LPNPTTPDAIRNQDFGALLMAANYLIVRFKSDAAAKDRLELICKRRGMTRVEMMSRLIKWFSLQDDKIQSKVLEAMTKESMVGVAKTVLKRVASD
jgi:hypothetical protein